MTSSHHRRGPWSQSEDAYLMNLVQSQGALNWVRIASILGSRTPKQCRERFHQNLKPTLNHEPITPEEGVQIERLVNELGKRWAEIARRLHGRSDNAVKNWWNGSQNRRKRMDRRKGHNMPYEDELMGYGRAGYAIPRSLPPPSRPLPPPLYSTSLHSYQRDYGVETPLQSPAYSPDSDISPGFSDHGCHYATSPRCYEHRSPKFELPPLKMANGCRHPPRATPSPGDTRLPPLSTMLPEQHRYVPQTQLPTAPSSPAARHLPPLNMERREERRTRVDVATSSRADSVFELQTPSISNMERRDARITRADAASFSRTDSVFELQPPSVSNMDRRDARITRVDLASLLV